MFVSAVSCRRVHVTTYSLRLNVGKAELWFGGRCWRCDDCCTLWGGGGPACVCKRGRPSGGERGLSALWQIQMFFLCVGILHLMWSFWQFLMGLWLVWREPSVTVFRQQTLSHIFSCSENIKCEMVRNWVSDMMQLDTVLKWCSEIVLMSLKLF